MSTEKKANSPNFATMYLSHCSCRFHRGHEETTIMIRIRGLTRRPAVGAPKLKAHASVNDYSYVHNPGECRMWNWPEGRAATKCRFPTGWPHVSKQEKPSKGVPWESLTRHFLLCAKRS